MLVQATYWHDPLNETLYKDGSSFLADINNENSINQDYIDRLQTLENLVLVMFENDTIVQPVQTEWFGFYKSGQAVDTEPLEESTLYTEDRLGLQQLNADSKLHFLATPGNHLRFDWEWFNDNILEPYLSE